jgi:hypothetical protein
LQNASEGFTPLANEPKRLPASPQFGEWNLRDNGKENHFFRELFGASFVLKGPSHGEEPVAFLCFEDVLRDLGEEWLKRSGAFFPAVFVCGNNGFPPVGRGPS